MELLYSILFAGHMLGLAAIVGSFFVQLRRKSDFVLSPTLYGAIVQVVTGVGLLGIAEAADADVDMVKYSVKLGIALIVLAAAIVAVVQHRKGGKVQPWFHAAGGLAIVNVLVAVFW